MILGYLVPEFPGQTHIMFWRELAQLRSRGLTVDVLSTRRPTQARTHEWSQPAERQTTYLYPITAALLCRALSGFATAGGAGRSRWLAALRTSERDPGVHSLLRFIGLAVAGASVGGIARQRRWSHLHVHSCADAANVALFAAALSGITYSITLHGPLGDYGGNQRLKWRQAAFAIVITERLRADVEAMLQGSLPPLRVVGMGVEPAELCRTSPYVPWRRETEAQLFSCGRLNPAKGHLVSVAAVALLRGRGIEVQLFIAGEDEQGGSGYRATVERRIAEVGLADFVHLLGAVSEAEVRRQLELAHVFVLASEAEPLGVAIMEALSMEVPAVVTAAGGVAELVEDCVNGVLVEPGSPDALAAGVQRILEDGELAVRVGACGRRTVIERYTTARNAEVLVEELRRIST